MKALLTGILLCAALFTSAQEGINKLDANGKKQGKWEKKFDNGQVRYTGQFKDDKPVGVFFYYYENGVKSSEVTYVSESDLSHSVHFHTNGVKMSEGDYFKQQRHGEWRYYDNKTLISMIEHYDNGILTGDQTVFYLNGKPSAEYIYVNGLKTGPFKEYFSDGKEKIVGTYLDNNFDGDYVQYYDDGTLYIKGQYKAAVKDGMWYYYSTDGKVMAQEMWDVGKLIRKVLAEGYEEVLEPVDLPEEKLLDEDTIMEQYFNEMNGMQSDGK